MITNICACPFCSSNHLHVTHHLVSYSVECGTCKATGPRKKSEFDAVVSWNVLSANVELAKMVEKNDLLSRVAQVENAVQQLEVNLYS